MKKKIKKNQKYFPKKSKIQNEKTKKLNKNKTKKKQQQQPKTNNALIKTVSLKLFQRQTFFSMETINQFIIQYPNRNMAK